MKPFTDLPRALLLEVAARAGLLAAADHAAATGRHVLLLWDDLTANERTHVLATCEDVLAAPVATEGAELAFETTVRGVLHTAGMPLVARAAYVRPPVAAVVESPYEVATANDAADAAPEAGTPPVLHIAPPPPAEGTSPDAPPAADDAPPSDAA